MLLLYFLVIPMSIVVHLFFLLLHYQNKDKSREPPQDFVCLIQVSPNRYSGYLSSAVNIHNVRVIHLLIAASLWIFQYHYYCESMACKIISAKWGSSHPDCDNLLRWSQGVSSETYKACPYMATAVPGSNIYHWNDRINPSHWYPSRKSLQEGASETWWKPWVLDYW